MSAPGSELAPKGWRVGVQARRVDLFAILALLVASIVFTTEQVSEHDMLSPIDEYQYVDYHAKVIDQGIVRQGEQAGPFARKYMMCHGVRMIETSPPNPKACRNPAKGTYPLNGGTTADLYSPIYFVTTRLLAQPLVIAGVDLVDAGRYVGGLWLGSAAIVLFLAMRRARVPTLAAFGLSMAMIGSLPAYWSTTYLSTDAPALLAGATALLLTVSARNGSRLALWLLPAAAAIATLVKVQNLVGFVAAAVYLVLAAAVSPRGEISPTRRLVSTLTDRRMGFAVATLAAGALAQGVWLAIRRAIATGPLVEYEDVVTFQPDFLLFEISNFFPRLAVGAVDPAMTGPWSHPVYLIGTCVATGGVVGLAVARGVPLTDRLVAVSTLATAAASAPALVLSIAIMMHSYITLPWRYGMTLFPWALFCAAVLIDTQKRWAQFALVALGVCTVVMSLLLTEG